MVKIDPFEKDSGFKEVTKMKHKSMGERDDQRERDVDWRRWCVLTFVCSTLLWVVLYVFLRSGFEGTYIDRARILVNILIFIPVGSGVGAMVMDLKIRAKDRKKLE